MELLSTDAPGCAGSQSDIEINIGQLEDKISWPALFGNPGPVVVEIGCGKGRFILRSARENPAVNYLGIEKSAKFSRILKERAAGAGNIRLLSWEAGYFVGKYVPENSVTAFHIYFPDPWPKKRHRKRRLVQPPFVAQLRNCLEPGGTIYYATDFEDYYQQMVEVSRACEGLAEQYSRTIRPAEADAEAADTNYERKYLLQGRLIYKAAYRKA